MLGEFEGPWGTPYMYLATGCIISPDTIKHIFFYSESEFFLELQQPEEVVILLMVAEMIYFYLQNLQRPDLIYVWQKTW